MDKQNIELLCGVWLGWMYVYDNVAEPNTSEYEGEADLNTKWIYDYGLLATFLRSKLPFIYRGNVEQTQSALCLIHKSEC